MFRVVFAAFCCAAALLGQEGQSPQSILQEAVAFHQAGKLDQAIKDYYLFLDIVPDAPEVRSNLGAALSGAGRYAEAIEQYKFALSQKPDPRVRLNLALAYYKTADFPTADEELKKVRDADPSNVQVMMLLADCDLKLGDNKGVIDLLNPLYRTNPEDMGVLYLLGTALVRDGETAQGQIVIDQIMKRGDSAEARLLMGTTKFEAHDFKSAIADLKRALEMNPNLPGVHAYYGMALLVMGDTGGAQQAFKDELAQDPNNFDANLRMGALLRINQDPAGASPYIQRAQKLRPHDPGVRFQVASLALAQGNEEQARNQLEALVKEYPSFTEAHVTLATLYYREKRKEDGDRERAVVRELNQQQQALAPGAKGAQ